jgi:magnesium-transporting ATPase (P-type)
VIFDNILKFIKYILTGISEKSVPFSLLLFWFTFPLLAIHILWINLVTDGLPGLALASEPAEGNVMNRQPRDPNKTFCWKDGITYNKCWVANGFWSLWAFSIGLFMLTFHIGKQLLLRSFVLVRWAMSWQFVLDENLF